MILGGLNNIIQEPNDINSQIKLCELNAIVTRKNGDRDISNIFNAIAENLKKIERNPSNPIIPDHDRYSNNTAKKNAVGETTITDGNDDPRDGKGAGKH